MGDTISPSTSMVPASMPMEDFLLLGFQGDSTATGRPFLVIVNGLPLAPMERISSKQSLLNRVTGIVDAPEGSSFMDIWSK